MKGFILKPHEAQALAAGKPVAIWRVCKLRCFSCNGLDFSHPDDETIECDYCGKEYGASDLKGWGGEPCFRLPFPAGVPLFGKETWREGEGSIFRAEWDADDRIKGALDGGWKSSTTMPERIARIHLSLSDVRVRKPCDVTQDEAKAMGFMGGHGSIPGYAFSATPREHWRDQWKVKSNKPPMKPEWSLYHFSALATPVKEGK